MLNPAESEIWLRGHPQKKSHVFSHSSHTTKWINQGVMKLDTGKSNRCHEIIAFKAILHETKHVLITHPI